MESVPVAKETKPLLQALGGKAVASPPFWLMRQAGRYLPEYRALRATAPDFLKLCLTPELASEITLQPVRRFGMDGAILFSDILVIPHALGQEVAFREGEGPVLEVIRSPADVSRLRAEGVVECLGPVFETVRSVRGSLPAGTALIGFAGAPWTVAAYMVEGGGSKEFAAVKGWAYGDPVGFQELIDLLVEATSAYLIAQVDAGAEALQIFDTWAGLLPEPELQRWVVAPTAEIVRRLRERHPAVPLIGFPRGIGACYPAYARATGVDAVGLDTAVPLGWAAQTVQTQCTVQGNLDPHVLVVGGAALRREALRILDALGHGPFIFNLGHGVLQQTPPDHVSELAEIIRSWHG